MVTKHDIERVIDEMDRRCNAEWWCDKRPSRLCDYIVRALGGRVVGYSTDDNPDQTVAHDGEGIDFAVVDNWLVDVWSMDAAKRSDREVYDLDDSDDAALVRGLYGPSERWKESGGLDPIWDERNGPPGAWNREADLFGIIASKELDRVLKSGPDDRRRELRDRFASLPGANPYDEQERHDDQLRIAAIIDGLTEAIGDGDEFHRVPPQGASGKIDAQR